MRMSNFEEAMEHFRAACAVYENLNREDLRQPASHYELRSLMAEILNVFESLAEERKY